MKELEFAIQLLLSGGSSPEIQNGKNNYWENIVARENIDLTDCRFYASFLQRMRRYPVDDDHHVKTAAVSITDRINLYVNRSFFKKCTLKQRVEILKHECDHLINGHITRAEKSGINDQSSMKNFNIAADAAINGPRKSLHELGVTVDKLSETVGKTLKSDETVEYYYAHIKKFAEENPDKCGNMPQTVDDHSTWEEGEASGTPKEIQEQIVKSEAKTAVDNAGGAGSVSGGIYGKIERLNTSVVPWQQVLRSFFNRGEKFEKVPTRKKLNRRYRTLVQGKRKNPITHLVIAMDVSGSVSDRALAQFFAEIKKIHSLNKVDITIIEADCEVKNVYKYDPKDEITISGRGGTAYNPAINKALEIKADAIIYLGDMDCYDNEKIVNPKIPFLWGIVGNQEPPAKFGKKCKIECPRN